MSGHVIRWEYAVWGVDGVLLCQAPADADCRLASTCGCDEWDEILTDETGRKYHALYSWAAMAEHGEVETRHYMEPKPGWCNICEWLNNGGILDNGQDGAFVIGQTPIEPQRVIGGGYQWKRAE